MIFHGQCIRARGMGIFNFFEYRVERNKRRWLGGTYFAFIGKNEFETVQDSRIIIVGEGDSIGGTLRGEEFFFYLHFFNDQIGHFIIGHHTLEYSSLKLAKFC